MSVYRDDSPRPSTPATPDSMPDLESSQEAPGTPASLVELHLSQQGQYICRVQVYGQTLLSSNPFLLKMAKSTQMSSVKTFYLIFGLSKLCLRFV